MILKLKYCTYFFNFQKLVSYSSYSQIISQQEFDSFTENTISPPHEQSSCHEYQWQFKSINDILCASNLIYTLISFNVHKPKLMQNFWLIICLFLRLIHSESIISLNELNLSCHRRIQNSSSHFIDTRPISPNKNSKKSRLHEKSCAESNSNHFISTLSLFLIFPIHNKYNSLNEIPWRSPKVGKTHRIRLPTQMTSIRRFKLFNSISRSPNWVNFIRNESANTIYFV